MEDIQKKEDVHRTHPKGIVSAQTPLFLEHSLVTRRTEDLCTSFFSPFNVHSGNSMTFALIV